MNMNERRLGRKKSKGEGKREEKKGQEHALVLSFSAPPLPLVFFCSVPVSLSPSLSLSSITKSCLQWRLTATASRPRFFSAITRFTPFLPIRAPAMQASTLQKKDKH